MIVRVIPCIRKEVTCLFFERVPVGRSFIVLILSLVPERLGSRGRGRGNGTSERGRPLQSTLSKTPTKIESLENPGSFSSVGRVQCVATSCHNPSVGFRPSAVLIRSLV